MSQHVTQLFAIYQTQNLVRAGRKRGIANCKNGSLTQVVVRFLLPIVHLPIQYYWLEKWLYSSWVQWYWISVIGWMEGRDYFRKHWRIAKSKIGPWRIWRCWPMPDIYISELLWRINSDWNEQLLPNLILRKNICYTTLLGALYKITEDIWFSFPKWIH